MRFFKYSLFSILLFYCGLSQAHVNSPDITYQGKAGKYNLLVDILPPDVIPGIAKISINVENYKGVKVYAQIQYFSIGKNGSVPPERATPVEGGPGWFDCSSWMMISGPADMHIIVDGPLGRGSVNIPVMSVATANRRMPMVLGVSLLILGLVLFALMITIVSASVSDGLTKPGETPPRVKRKKRVSMLITAFLLTVILIIAAYWCRDERGTYLTYLYKPIPGHSIVFKYQGQNVLHLWVDNKVLTLTHQSLNYVVPDHGKIMHLVLVRLKTLDAFAHLHPIRQDSLNFLVNLPPALPPGQYFLYGDVVGWNGFAETIIDTVKIPESPPAQTPVINNIKIATSPDDAWLISSPVTANINKSVSICGADGISFKAKNGITIIWEHKAGTPVKAKRFVSLKFHVLDTEGKSPTLQPYMGMTGHAIVAKYDGSVYAHLHPVGNFAMASQQAIDRRMNYNNSSASLPDPKKFRDSIDKLIIKIDNMTEDQRNNYLMAEMGMGKSTGMDKSMDMGKSMDMASDADAKCGSIVQFPYTFPGPGKYRIWMEVKINGKILTSAFDTTVIN